MQYPTTKHPLAERGTTHETDHPYREGRSLVLRLPFTTRAVALGVWMTSQGDEQDVLRRAVGSRDLGEYRDGT